MSWAKNRPKYLSVVFFGVVAAMIRLTSCHSSSIEKKYVAFDFSKSIDMPLWHLQASGSLHENNQQQENRNFDFSKKIINAYQYSLSKASKNLTVDLRYIVNTDGEMSHYLNYFYDWGTSSGQLEENIHYLENVGYYTLSLHQGSSVLTSCINPNGEATVLGRQFVLNRNTRDFKLERLLPWLTNRASLKDERCLWVYMRLTPVRESALKESYAELQEIWSMLYRKNKDNFPRDF